jgi:hypothetical protein
MDKTRKLLLILLGLVLLVSLSAVLLNLKMERVKYFRNQSTLYRQKRLELTQKNPVNRQALMERLETLKRESGLEENKPVTVYRDVYDFGRVVLDDLKMRGLSINQYRLFDEKGEPLMEVQTEGSPVAWFDYLRHVSDEHPECFISVLKVTKRKGDLRIFFRMGYEQDH